MVFRVFEEAAGDWNKGRFLGPQIIAFSCKLRLLFTFKKGRQASSFSFCWNYCFLMVNSLNICYFVRGTFLQFKSVAQKIRYCGKFQPTNFLYLIWMERRDLILYCSKKQRFLTLFWQKIYCIKVYENNHGFCDVFEKNVTSGFEYSTKILWKVM